MKRWRYRPLQAAAVAALAALMTACAAFAPLYYRAMQQALTDITLSGATVTDTSVQLSMTPGDDFYDAGPLPQPEQLADQLPAAYRSDFHEPILGYAANAGVLPGGLTDPYGDLTWRSGQCDHLSFTDGACPDGPGEIAVSAADVENFGLDVGSTVRIAGATNQNGSSSVARLKVVGVYEQQVSDYWFGQSLTGRSGVVISTGAPAPPQHDVWITSRDSFDNAVVEARSSSAGYLVDDDAVGVDELLALGPVVDGLAHRRPDVGVTPVKVVSGLPDLAHGVQDQIDQSRVTVPLLMAQLCLLAVVVLWLILLAITEQRRPEVALARLRGRGRHGARRLLLAELLPITLLALVPGALLAVVASWFARAVLLPGDPPFELGWPFLAAVAAAAVVLTSVTLVAVSRVVREPVERLLRRVPPRATGWALGAADAIVIAGAGGIVVVFATGGLDGPVALAAPGLLAIVVGLLLAHLTTPTAALYGRRQLRRGRVRVGVSMLDAARSPATRRIIAIVTLASALAVFSADALIVGQRNRATAAAQQAGAPRVLDVDSNDLADIRAALADIDPEGDELTPVVRVHPPGNDAPDTLAIVASSFRKIALFPGGGPSDALWDKLAPPDAKPIDITGTELDIDVDDSTLTSTRVDNKRTPVTLGLDLVNQSGETLHTALGTFAAKSAHRHFHQLVSCSEGCHVTGVWTDSLPGATIEGRVTLRNLTARPSGEVVPLGPAEQWTEFYTRETGHVSPSSTTPDELTVTFQGQGVSPMTMQQRWLPTIVPALVAGPLPPGGSGNQFTLTGLDGEAQPAAKVGSLARVPASEPHTFVTDLESLQRGRPVLATDRVQVWFGDDDPALLDRVTDALSDRGIAVAQTTTLRDIERSYDESVAAWSLQLAALVGGVALLIALLVLVVSAVSGWRFRTRDFAALRMSGVPRRSIRSIAVAAQLPAVLVGVVAGGVSGIFGAQLAMPIVPLFATAPQVSTLDLDTAWWAVLVAVALSLVVLGAGSVLIGRALAARAELPRLRETM
ncbi:FtsX-like permease family protein [Nocardioides conyzicola]|uniref:ABC3 transporter permease C-terminal domain-containing protein n=1 Tax=Nocardioides conyzicola TaxID=1651781 RepID=A0ABP8Y3T2_9ACTN